MEGDAENDGVSDPSEASLQLEGIAGRSGTRNEWLLDSWRCWRLEYENLDSIVAEKAFEFAQVEVPLCVRDTLSYPCTGAPDKVCDVSLRRNERLLVSTS